MYNKPRKIKDVKYILDNLRDQDRAELEAAHGHDWKKITFEGAKKLPKKYCRIGYSDNHEPVLMYGIAPMVKVGVIVPINNVGVIWMLSTQNIEKEQISFLKQAKDFINRSNKQYKLLCNKVHAENTLALKWLKWLGFTVESPKGLGKKKFLFFYKESD